MKNSPEERFYRKDMNAPDLVYYRVKIEQSDLFVGTEMVLKDRAEAELALVRSDIKAEIAKRPEFLTSFYPLLYTGSSSQIVHDMYRASSAVGVGPMAAVAGATAAHVGASLAELSNNVIVENGGDIFIKSLKPRKVMLYAGQSVLSGKVALEIAPGTWGICTSAYSIGHSYSDGRCDAAVVVSHDCALADAAATALGNSIKKDTQLEDGVKEIMRIKGVIGALAVINEKIAALGEIKLTSA